MNSPPSVVLPIIFSFFFFHNGKGCSSRAITLFRSPSSMKMEKKKERKKTPSISCDWRQKEFLVLSIHGRANVVRDFQFHDALNKPYSHMRRNGVMLQNHY